MIDETLFDAEEKMEKAVSVGRDDLSTIRTGRANPGMFSRIVIDYYGSATPITQLASINVPEARLVVIKPYEASQLGPIETAIRNSDLGLNPTNDGTLIRVAVPQLTEERRRRGNAWLSVARRIFAESLGRCRSRAASQISVDNEN